MRRRESTGDLRPRTRRDELDGGNRSDPAPRPLSLATLVGRNLYVGTILLTLCVTSALAVHCWSEYRSRLNEVRRDVLEETKEDVVNIVDQAVAQIEYDRRRLAKQGKTTAEIQQKVKDRLHSISFDDGNGYLFVTTFDGIELVNRTRPTLIDRNVLEVTDPNGVTLVRELIEAAKQPEGRFVSYIWNKPNGATGVRKISYARGIQDWQWMVGAGLYLDHVDAAVAKMAARVRRSFLTEMAIIVGFAAAVLATTMLSLRQVVGTIRAELGRLIGELQVKTATAKTSARGRYTIEEFSQIADTAAEAFLELEKSEKRLANVIRGTNVGTWEWNIQTGETVFNERWAEMIGHSLKELEPVSIETWLDRVHPDDRRRSESLLKCHFAGHSNVYDCECRVKHRDGSWIWVQDRGRVSDWDEEGNPLIMSGTHFDITDRKRAEDLLAAERDLAVEFSRTENLQDSLELCLDAALRLTGQDSAGIWLQDGDGNSDIACHRGISDELVREVAHFDADDPLQQMLVTGYPFCGAVSDLPEPAHSVCAREGMQGVTILPIQSEGKWLATIATASRTRERTPDWILHALLAIKVHLRKTIVRLKGQERLRASEARLRAITDSARDAILMMDPAGTITYWNPAAESILGYRSEEVLGRNLHDLLAPQRYIESHRGAFGEFVHTGKGPAVGKTIELEARRKDGREIAVSLSLSSVSLDGQWHAVGVLRDITDRKRAEDEACFQLSFQKAVAEISSRFVTLSADGFDDAVNDALGRLGELFDVDRAYVFRFSDDLRTMNNTHEWCAEGVEPLKDRNQGIPVDDAPWFKERLEAFRPVRIPDGDALPKEAGRMQSALRSKEIQSSLCLPMVGKSGVPVGFVGFDSVRRSNCWPDAQIMMLQVLAEITVGAVQRWHAEEALRESEAFQSTLLDSIDAGIVVIDPVTHIIERANQKTAEMFGASVDEMVGRACHKYFCPSEENCCPITDGHQEIVNADKTMLCADGSRIPILKSVRRIRINGREKLLETFVDITDRKRAEKELAERTNILRTLLDGIPDVIALQEIDHTVVAYNKAGYDFLGKTADEACGAKCFTLLGRDSPCPTCLAADAIAKKCAVSGERYFPELDQWIRSTSIPVLDENGRPTMVVEQLQDVTEHKRAQIELTDSLSALESAYQSLEEYSERAEEATRAKSAFLANMSHEIRTPMTAILGYAEFLLSEPELYQAPPERVEAIRTIQRNGKYLLGLLNDILDISKIEAGKLEVTRTRCSPRRVISEVASLMQVRAREKDLLLEVEYAGALPKWIESDPIRLRQILINLVGNAVRFTETGKVRLVTHFERGEDDRPRLRFDITDTGIGLTEEQIGRLFQPFMQVDSSPTRRFGGTGLGLSISKRLAEMLGGDISVTSSPGAGSTFSVTVDTGLAGEEAMLETPDDYEESARPEPLSVLPSGKFPSRCRILLAEDGPDNQRLITFILRKAGADVTLAENGQLAYEEATAAWNEGRPFNLILMDMQMPIMDGYTATRTLREAGYDGPIVALTAHAMEGDDVKCRDAGCDDYLTKPIDHERFLPTIAKWVGSAPKQDDFSTPTPNEHTTP